MKLRWLHFLIASQLLLASSGWAANAHFCSKFGQSVSLFSKKCGGCAHEKPAKSCCEKKALRTVKPSEKGFSKPQNCCSDQKHVFQLKSEKETSNSLKINELAQKSTTSEPLIFAVLPPAFAFSSKLARLFSYRPPPVSRAIWRLVRSVRC